MSKIDAMRAMREAKYAARQARAGAPGETTARRVAAPPAGAPSTVDPPAAATPHGADARCGHRSMNGRTCTREQGHAAKSHRYG